MFKWANCNHVYCTKCAITNINVSLSYCNKLPRCKVEISQSENFITRCNQLLANIGASRLRQVTLKRYQFNRRRKNSILSSDGKDYLITGYIKSILNTTTTFIPMNIISLMFDFYSLIYHMNIPCESCKHTGIKYRLCGNCNGEGYNILDCESCKTSPGICIYNYFIDCSHCNGSGECMIDCACDGCEGYGSFTSNCAICNGLGICIICGGSGFNCGGCVLLKGICMKCQGTGTQQIACIICNGSGKYKIKQTCYDCNGNGKILQSTICNTCQGLGIYKLNCTVCDNSSGMIAYKCPDCNGEKE